MKILKKQAGLILSELVVTLSMIAILISLAAPSYSQFISKRTVAGAANLVATFFEDIKMKSVKRNEYVTISYKKSANGLDWCLGAITGKDTVCDCMAETPQCLIDSIPMVLSNVSYNEFDDFNVVFTEGYVSFDPVRGILTNPEKSVLMQIQQKDEEYLVRVSVNATGSVSKCSPAGQKLVGYQSCI
jgi:type IV fimbrial biogenesis protein FimT